MSNALAIAAVTATLEAILGVGVHTDSDLSDTAVTALPLDKARGALTTNQLNIYLYQILPNAAWRNMDLAKPGESGIPPQALALHYLFTVFGRDNDNTQPFDHHLLGRVMSILYDHALLGPEEIALSFPGSDLERQVDRVRITFQPLSIEEISKLWTGFATQYRLSVSYEISVVLIESTQAPKTPVPVLTRGPQDQGPTSQGNLIPPFPALASVIFPNGQVTAKLGDILTLTGNLLDGTNIGVIFATPAWSTTTEIAPNNGATANQLSVTIPPAPDVWPAGPYTLTVAVKRPGETYRRTTNPLNFTISPTITITPLNAAAGSVTLTITCRPEIQAGQQVSLLLNDQPTPSAPISVATPTLTFTVNLVAGVYLARLRVDGVDSVFIDRSVTPPAFIASQKVIIT